MRSAVLDQIEEMIGGLSREEQLWLIEQLAHRLREGPAKSNMFKQPIFKSQLDAMAADPEIQAELRKIDHEFSVTEANGLESK